MKRDFKSFLQLYDRSFSAINNLNSEAFWNKKLSLVQELSKQDGMTKERICVAASYIPKRAKRILDLGAGYGFIEEFLKESEENYELHGVDLSSVGVESLRKRFKGKFSVSSAHKLKYTNNYFDCVLALELLSIFLFIRHFPYLER